MGMLAHSSIRPGQCVPGVHWFEPEGKVTSVDEHSTNNAPGRPASVSSIGDESDKSRRSGKPAYAKTMDLCYNDEASETSSVQSWDWECDDNDKKSNNGEENGNKNSKTEQHATRMNSSLEDYQQQLIKLESQNKLRLMIARQEQQQQDAVREEQASFERCLAANWARAKELDQEGANRESIADHDAGDKDEKGSGGESAGGLDGRGRSGNTHE